MLVKCTQGTVAEAENTYITRRDRYLGFLFVLFCFFDYSAFIFIWIPSEADPAKKIQDGYLGTKRQIPKGEELDQRREGSQ